MSSSSTSPNRNVSQEAADRLVDNLAEMSAADSTKRPTSAEQNQAVAAASSNIKNEMALSISPVRQKTRQQKQESEKVFYEHCSKTYKEEFNYFNAMIEPAASPLHHVRARESVHRNYVEKDRNLDFGFLCEDFFEGREMIELVEEEIERRKRIENEALADEDEKLVDLLGQGTKEAGVKTQLRSCQAEEHCERSRILWEWQKSVRVQRERENKEYLVHHHKETCRVNDEKRENFFSPPPLSNNAGTSSSTHHQKSRGKTELEIIREKIQQEEAVGSNKKNNNNSNKQQQQRSSTAAADTNNIAGNSGTTSAMLLLPQFVEVDFTFLIEYEDKNRQLIERTALQEFRSAERALRAFQVDALNDIDILRLRKAETLKRAYITGWAFRFHLLMLQERESAAREFVVSHEEKQLRTQIDVVENKCWLRAKENETWRTDRDRNFQVAEERKQRERQWQKDRLDEEDRRNFTRNELETRIEASREEHYERSILLEQHERDFNVLRRKQIATEVEQEVSSNTLHWNEQFHAQIVVSERQKRRALFNEESNERSELLSEEVRDYIAARRDELFDKDTSDAMKYIDKVRQQGEDLSASSLAPVKLSDNNNNSINAYSSSSLAPRPPPTISYQRGGSGNNASSRPDSSSATGASLRAPRVS